MLARVELLHPTMMMMMMMTMLLPTGATFYRYDAACCVFIAPFLCLCVRVCVCCGTFFLLLFFALVTRLIRGEERGNRRHHSNAGSGRLAQMTPFSRACHMDMCVCLCVCVCVCACVWKPTKQEARVAFIMLRRIINSAPLLLLLESENKKKMGKPFSSPVAMASPVRLVLTI